MLDPQELEVLAHQQEEDGDDRSSIQLMEKALQLRVASDATIGGTREATLAAAERLVVKCNTVAVRCFKRDDYDAAAAYLRLAVSLTEAHGVSGRSGGLFGPEADATRNRLRSMTMNNLGCMERRRGQTELAVRYLESASTLDGGRSASTLVNLGALYAQLDKMAQGANCCQRAIQIIEEAPSAGDVGGLRAVAWHNLATCLESSSPNDAATAYESALQCALAEFGPNSGMTESIRRNYQRFQAVVPSARAPPAASSAPSTATAEKPAGRVPNAFLPPIGGVSAPRGRGAVSDGAQESALHRFVPAPSSVDAAPKSSRHATSQGHVAGESAPLSHSSGGGLKRDPEPPKSARVTAIARPPARTQSSDPPLRGERSQAGSRRRSETQQPQSPPRNQALNAHGKDAPPPATEPKPPSTAPPAASGRVAARAPPAQATKSQTASDAHPQAATTTATAGASRKPPPHHHGASSAATLTEEDERRKEDVVAFLVTRLGALIAVEEQYETRYAAAVRIQNLFRGALARMQYVRKRSNKRKMTEFKLLRETKVAHTLIRFFQRLVERRRESERELERLKQQSTLRERAATKVQSVARRWLAKQLTRRLRKFNRRFHVALRKLQCWFRRCLARRLTERMRLAFNSQQESNLHAEMRHRAARDIQRIYRSYRTFAMLAVLRKERRLAVEKERDSIRVVSAKRIQRCWRQRCSRRRVASQRAAREARILKQRRYEDTKFAVLTLQRWARGIAARSRVPQITEPKRRLREARRDAKRGNAALRIQCAFRCHRARRAVGRLRLLRRQKRVEGLRWLHGRMIARIARGAIARLAIVPQYAAFLRADRQFREQLRRLQMLATKSMSADIRSVVGPPPPAAITHVSAAAVEPPAAPPTSAASRTPPRAQPTTSESSTSSPSSPPSSTKSPQSPLPASQQTPPHHATPAAMTTTPPSAAPHDSVVVPLAPPTPGLRSEASAGAPSDGPAAASTAPPVTTDAPHETSPVEPSVDKRSPTAVTAIRLPRKPPLSMERVEEARKLELRRRQETRLRDLEREESRRQDVLRSAKSGRPHTMADEPLAAKQSWERKRDAAARKLQRFLRMTFDRSLYRQRLTVLHEYIDQVVHFYEESPSRLRTDALVFRELHSATGSLPPVVAATAPLLPKLRVLHAFVAWKQSLRWIAYARQLRARRERASSELAQFARIIEAKRQVEARRRGVGRAVDSLVASDAAAAAEKPDEAIANIDVGFSNAATAADTPTGAVSEAPSEAAAGKTPETVSPLPDLVPVSPHAGVRGPPEADTNGGDEGQSLLCTPPPSRIPRPGAPTPGTIHRLPSASADDEYAIGSTAANDGASSHGTLPTPSAELHTPVPESYAAGDAEPQTAREATQSPPVASLSPSRPPARPVEAAAVAEPATSHGGDRTASSDRNELVVPPAANPKDNLEARDGAARRIGRFFRFVVARRAAQRRAAMTSAETEKRAVLEARNYAALRIQCAQRKRVARARLAERRQQRDNRWQLTRRNTAALKIQTQFRGHVARNHTARLRTENQRRWEQFRQAAAHEVAEDYSVFL